MPSAGFGTLREIGKVHYINEYADPELNPTVPFPTNPKQQQSKTFSTYRRSLMRPIDIFPVKFFVDITALSSILLNANCSELPITVNFVKGIIEYNLKLAAIGLCDKLVTGLRIWVNNETSSTDAIQNNYKENKIAEQFNNIIDSASKMNEYSKSLGIISDVSQGSIKSPIAAALMDGRHLSLPKIWEKTDYTPNLDLTVKLISPYGNEKSFIKNVAKPLLYLTALTAPSTYDGVTYGMPSNMYVRAYGITFIPLAIADSFSFVRGGTNGRVNWQKQPLEIAVSMSFKPAMPGFAAFVAPTFDFGVLPGNLGDMLGSLAGYAEACAQATGGSGIIGSLYQCGVDPIGKIKDLESGDLTEDILNTVGRGGTMKIPGVTSLGSIIQSLRPLPPDLVALPPSLMDNYKNSYTPPPPKFNQDAFAVQTYTTATEILNNIGANMSVDQLHNMVQTDNANNIMSTV